MGSVTHGNFLGSLQGCIAIETLPAGCCVSRVRIILLYLGFSILQYIFACPCEYNSLFDSVIASDRILGGGGDIIMKEETHLKLHQNTCLNVMIRA